MTTTTPTPRLGTLYALGVGPGDPELLTLRARRILHEVPRVFAASRHGGRSYALEVVAGFLHLDRPGQAVTLLPFPAPGQGWREHTHTVVAGLADGDAAFVTEGDPLFYSSFIGVLAELATAYPTVRVCVVPGVASPMAAAALAGQPLADDDQRLAVLPAMYALDVLPGALRHFDTLVLLKVAPVLDRVLDCLEAAGLGDRTTYVRRVGRPEQALLVGARAIRTAPAEVTSDYFSLLLVRVAR